MNKEMMKALQMATSKIPLQDLKFTLPFLTNNNLQSKFQQLQHEGYCVLDNVFDTNFISSLREEITIAKEMDAMDINHTHLILVLMYEMFGQYILHFYHDYQQVDLYLRYYYHLIDGIVQSILPIHLHITFYM